MPHGGWAFAIHGLHGWDPYRTSRNSQVDAWNEGRYDGSQEAKRSYSCKYAHLPLMMGRYIREDLPF
jgi:hypothetical protein